MKKSFLKLALAVLTVGLLGSCSKINERLDNLEKKVSDIENEQIASINSQISGITSSISDLGQIRSDISSLKQSAENHGIDIFNLEEADRALADRIVNLEDYVDAVLPNYAEKEWVEATFSTLEQYEETCDTIAKIDARIGALDAKLSKDIKACADSLTKWVNKTFEGYYTAAQMDAKLGQMKSDIDSARAAGKITDAKADSLAGELAKVKPEVDTAKANIRAEYKAAVKSAIETSEGKLTKALNDAIATVNGKITSLTGRVDALETSVATLTGMVDKLEKMIQSVTIVPAYSDGSVEAINGLLELNLIVSPSSAAKGLTTKKVNILLNSVTTKAASVDTVATDKIKSFIVDDTKGTVEIKADISDNIKALQPQQLLTVAVNVTDGGLSDVTTEFVSVDNTPGYTVKFNDGTTPAPGDTTVLKGGKINKPADPTREDYFFKNWFTKKYNSTEKEVDWNFETMTVSQDTTLYADWDKGAKVTFRKDTVNLTVCKDTVVRPGTQVNKPAVDPDSTGYAFKGWFTRKADGTFDKAWDFNTDVTKDKDTTLYAKWAKVMTVAQLVATNSEFPVSSEKGAIPENVWVNANNDTCYFVTGDYLYFINGKKSKEVTKEFGYDLVRDDDGNYAKGEIKFVMAADRDSVVKITLTSTNTPELDGDYAPESPLPAGALKGVFSVSETKKVRFSQGNLKYDDTKWKFYDHQYDYLKGYDNSPVSLFPWGYDATKTISLGSNNCVKTHNKKGDKLDYDKASSEGGDDWGVAYCESNDITVGIWRTLSKEEWEYLIETRTMTNGKARYSIPGHGVTIGSTTYNGLFLYPDNYNGEVVSGSMTWDDINAAGIVFLPAAGCYGSGYVARDESEGFYWSSSAYSEYSSYLMYFDNTGTVRPDKGDDEYDDCKREKNYSVRLVTEVK